VKKPLFDPFVTFHVYIELLGAELHPYFVYKTQKIPFQACTSITIKPDSIFVYGGIARPFEGEFAGIERLFGPIISFTEEEMEEFVASYLIDPPDWGPRVEVIEPFLSQSESSSEKKESVKARCILQLVDDTGAFVEPKIVNGNKEEEKRFFQDLADVGYVYKPMGRSSYYCPTHLVKEALILLHGMGVEITGPDYEPILFFVALEQQPILQPRALTISGQFKTAKMHFSLIDALDATTKGKMILRKSGQALFLDHQDLDLYRQIPYKIESEKITIQRFFAPEIYNRFQGKEIEGLIPYQQQAVSPAFVGKLFPFQQEGLNWLHFHYENRFSALLADEMGLGKTVQAIAFLSRYLHDKTALIVAPLTLLTQWREQIKKFAPSILQNVTLISYQKLRSFAETLKNFHFIILDEAQLLRNRKTKGFEAVAKIEADFKIALSGTPIENQLSDLTNLFTILLPELMENIDHTDIERIKALTKPFILRRMKKEVVADMPEKMEEIVYVDLYEEQKEGYDILRQELVRDLKEGKEHVFAILTKLRQQVLCPSLVNQTLPSAKLDRVIEDLIELIANGQKVLVFSHFATLLQLLAKQLEALKMPYFYLDGQTRHRDRVVDAFKQYSGGAPFLMTLKAGGVGLNLVEADTVFIFEPWWNPYVEHQAIDRAHRVGRDKPLIARRYIAVNTIEEHIEKIKKEKSFLAEQIIEDSAVSHEILETLLKEIL